MVGQLLKHGVRSGCRRFHADESGSMEAMAYLFLVVVVGIGVVCGLTTLRDQVSQAFGDIGDAMASVNQTYTVTMTFAQIDGGTTTVTYGYAGSGSVTQTAGTGPGDMELCVAASDEN
jgi:Flp pilus assembly pilin Flp